MLKLQKFYFRYNKVSGFTNINTYDLAEYIFVMQMFSWKDKSYKQMLK